MKINERHCETNIVSASQSPKTLKVLSRLIIEKAWLVGGIQLISGTIKKKPLMLGKLHLGSIRTNSFVGENPASVVHLFLLNKKEK